MKYLATTILIINFLTVKSQSIENQNVQVSKISFDANNELIIKASPTSSKDDFNFLMGNWTMRNRKLKTRLNNCTEWDEFEGKWKVKTMLYGLGNIENYYTTIDDKPFEGVAIRFFNQKTKLWSIYWSDINSTGILGTPMIGSFYGYLGVFYMKDRFNNKEILVKYEWDKSDSNNPVWRQGISEDSGETWEWNWYMYGSRVVE